ncbi:MAG: hypothetical protein ABL993_05400, partial [Vicinamibacterales bacterium]
GSFIIIDPSTHFTAGAGMIVNPVREGSAPVTHTMTWAERLAQIARGAQSDEEAAELVRKALEEMLT